MFRTASLLFATYSTASLLVFLSLLSCTQISGPNSECATSCGNIKLSSPFRLQGDPAHCGKKSYELSCEADGTTQSHYAILYLYSGKYYVQAINYNNYTIRLVDAGVHKTEGNHFSNPVYSLTAFNFTSYYDGNSNSVYSLYYSQASPYYSTFVEVETTVPLIFLSCKNLMNFPDLYVETASCIMNTGNHSSSDTSLLPYSYFMLGRINDGYFRDPGPADVGLSCKITLMVRVSPPPTATDKYKKTCQVIYKQLAYGFELSWMTPYACEENCRPDEYCRFNFNKTGIVCFPYDRESYPYTMIFRTILRNLLRTARLIYKPFGIHTTTGVPWSYKNSYILVPVNCVVAYTGIFQAAKLSLGIPFLTALLIYKWQRRHLSMYENIEDFLRRNNNLMPVRYSYSEIKRMTRRFQDKLGEGGFGTVYKAKLRSGHLVAIKMLNKPKTNGQDFINEVASIGRIHHVNVVRLIGFCFDRSNRALVYDCMPNGSLDKYIFSNSQQGKGALSLSYEKIFEIAVGVARGIQYLHQGCNMRILHFDLKPHNILLDENFTAKVSDFGLARLYPLDDSIVSLTAARGTLGYMAPELYYKNIGGVSHKADVYSFGMLMLEMAGRRKNLNAAIDHSSEFSQMYFPTWVFDQLNQGKDIEIGDATEDEMKIIKKMIIVGLWCIQLKPIERPSMSKVIEMLEGEIESLQIPPKLFLYPQQMPADDLEDNLTTCASRETESAEINLSADTN